MKIKQESGTRQFLVPNYLIIFACIFLIVYYNRSE